MVILNCLKCDTEIQTELDGVASWCEHGAEHAGFKEEKFDLVSECCILFCSLFSDAGSV
jgi:Fe2+ or Zn2+ uptake regulation protein